MTATTAPPAPTTRTSTPRSADAHSLPPHRPLTPLSLEDLASAAGLGVSQFARRFKARVGCPPHRYLVRLRVEQAARLLRAGSMPIAQVAAACGFSHQEHLTRVIRSHLGTTPAALRRGGLTAVAA